MKYFIVVFTNDYVLILFLVKTNSGFFIIICGLVFLIVQRMSEKKHHMTPTEPFALLPRFVPKDYGATNTLLMLKKKALEKTFKDKIHATNHSHAIFVTEEPMSSCSSLRPRPFVVRAKNSPPLCRLQVAFWHYFIWWYTLWKRVVIECVREDDDDDDGVSYLNNQKACLVSYSMRRLLTRSLETTSTCHEESNIGCSVNSNILLALSSSLLKSVEMSLPHKQISK